MSKSFCPHCGQPKQHYNATCTDSYCQEAEYYANKARNKRKRRK